MNPAIHVSAMNNVRADRFVRTAASMGTAVTIEVVGGGDPARADAREAAVQRAFDWFARIEAICTRFDDESELRRLCARPGAPVPVSETLYTAIDFACAVARETGGAFDPTIGGGLEALGFTRHYRTGRDVTPLPDTARGASYRDVGLDPRRLTVTLRRPLMLDLGAVAKGLAVDVAARELAVFRDFAIDAGGDLYLSGRNADDAPWTVGIRHPREDGVLLGAVRVTDRAVCTSGDYERRAAGGAHHILDPRTGDPAAAVASVTVIAPTTVLADAVGTAVFVLGPAAGLRLFERLGVEGLIVTPALDRYATPGFALERAIGRPATAAS